jgi:hypothetical protein
LEFEPSDVNAQDSNEESQMENEVKDRCHGSKGAKSSDTGRNQA